MPQEVFEPAMQRDWTLATDKELKRGYQDMAADKDREAEAFGWSEALIGDGFETR